MHTLNLYVYVHKGNQRHALCHACPLATIAVNCHVATIWPHYYKRCIWVLHLHCACACGKVAALGLHCTPTCIALWLEVSYKMICTFIVMQCNTEIEYFLFFCCNMYLHGLPVAMQHKQNYCEPGFSLHEPTLYTQSCMLLNSDIYAESRGKLKSYWWCRILLEINKQSQMRHSWDCLINGQWNHQAATGQTLHGIRLQPTSMITYICTPSHAFRVVKSCLGGWLIQA